MRARVILQAKLNLEAKARAAAVEAAKEIYGVLDGRFAAAMSASVWEWPNETVRRKGKRKAPPVVVFSPRNIKDSGDLANSKVQTISGLVCTWRWAGLKYAAATHEGARLWNGGIIQPRPWTDAVLRGVPQAQIEPYDYRRAFRDAWLSAYRRGN